MNLQHTAIAGVMVAKADLREDARGTFARLFCKHSLAPVLGERDIVQINRSLTRRPGAVRGLHFQHPPAAEMKLVRCLRGRVWDVAVDLRAGSPTFLRWHAEELDPASGTMLIIPEGCAHGFQVLEPDSELLYLHTAAYQPAYEAGLRHDDPAVAISWPLPTGDLSERDRAHPSIADDFTGIHL